MKILRPTDVEVVLGIPPQLGKSDRVAIDTEIWRIPEDELHRPVGDFACATFCADGRTVYIVQNTEDLSKAFENIEPAVHVYHNAQFDIRQLRRWVSYPDRKRIWDTMLIEKIKYGGYYDDFALNDLVRRWCGIYLPKSEQKSFSKTDATEMTESQIFYAACDTVATWLVYQEQRQATDDTEFEIWTIVELPTLWNILDKNGIAMDVEKWCLMADENAKQAQKIRDSLGFNPASVPQTKRALEAEGFKVDSTNEATLSELKDSEIAKSVLAFRAFNKKASTYGRGFIESRTEGGIFYPSWFQIGAETGRMSGNAQQIPHDPEYRSCFIARPGNKLIIADYSTQEPRIAAYLSEDYAMMDIFNSGKDFYIEVAKELYEEEITKQDPRRQTMKMLVLGTIYAMSAESLAIKINHTVEEAHELLSKFFGLFRNLFLWSKNQVEFAEANGYVQTILGRKIWLNKFNNQWRRNALNAPVQGTAADMTKMADNLFREKFGSGAGRLTVHDEIVVEVAEEVAEYAAKLLEECMLHAGNVLHPGVKAKVEVFIGDNWSAKK